MLVLPCVATKDDLPGAGLPVSAIGLQPVHSLQLEVRGPLEAAQREVERLQVLFSPRPDPVHVCGFGCACAAPQLLAPSFFACLCLCL